MAQSAEEWFKQLCTDAGFDEATTTALTAAAKNDKFSSAVSNTLRRATDDFDAMQGRVKSFEKKIGEHTSYSQRAYEENQRLAAELEKLRTAGIDPNAGFDMSQYLTKQDWDKLNQERDNRYSAVLKDLSRITSRHAVKYGEELDTDALEQYARENNLPLSLAYDKWVQPREDAKRAQSEKDREAKFQEDLRKAREEGARDALSKHKLPVDTTPNFRSLIHHSPSADSIPKDMDGELLAAWNGVNRQ